MSRRPIRGAQYLTWVGEDDVDRRIREAKERGVRVRQDACITTEPDDPDEAPAFDGREPGCLLDRRPA